MYIRTPRFFLILLGLAFCLTVSSASAQESLLPAFGSRHTAAAASSGRSSASTPAAAPVMTAEQTHAELHRPYWGFDLGITSTGYVGNKNFIWHGNDPNAFTSTYLQFDDLGTGIGFIGGAKIGFSLSDKLGLEGKVRYLTNFTSRSENHPFPCSDTVNGTPISANVDNDYSLLLSNLDFAALLHYDLSDKLYLLGGLSFSSLLGNTISFTQTLHSTNNTCSYTNYLTGQTTGSTQMTQPGTTATGYFQTSRADVQIGVGSAVPIGVGSPIIDAELALSIPLTQWLQDGAKGHLDTIATLYGLPSITYPTQWYASFTIGIRFPFGGGTNDVASNEPSRTYDNGDGSSSATTATIDAEGKVPLTGRVTNKNGDPVDATMTVVDLSNNEVVATDKTDASGHYNVRVKAPGKYSVTADADGYLFGTAYFEVDNQGRILRSHNDIQLSEATTGRTRLLVFFDFDKADLQRASYPELDRAVRLMKAVPTMEVEIAGYTDSKGTPEYNRDLSQRRANAVRNYLISKGIPKARITAHGYGEDSPIASNDTDEGRAENRRVEFVVTKK